MIAPETTLAHYRVGPLIGSGGMGEVYRATDTKLGRDVALKILPPEMSESRIRIRRFLHEAKAASSLNHPNILTVYDAGEENRVHFIASELIAGSTLGDLIHRDQTPLRRILDYMAQAADGIAKAHAHGIVHRDLKPDNIMVTSDGFAKVLDFGLAKLIEAPDQEVTVPDRTRDGVVLGTAAYMSPEQAQGKVVDQRSDIFSFGSILYEAAARKRAFAGPSDPDTLHQIIHDHPMPVAGIPVELDRVIRRTLAKDPDERIQSMKDVSLELRDISRSFDDLKIVPAPPRITVPRTAWWAAGIVAALALGAAMGRFTRPAVTTAAPDEPIRFSISLPENAHFLPTPNSSTGLQFALSPNGKSIVFVAVAGSGRPQLWIRDLRSVEARPLAGTEGAWFPFWSPSGEEIGFFASAKLKRIAIGSSTAVTIADAPEPRGASWGADNIIVFVPHLGGPLYRVSATGGDVVPVSQIDKGGKERGHRWPYFLPDGKRFIFTSMSPNRDLRLGSIGSHESRVILTDVQSNAQYVSGGEILFLRRGSLYSQAVDEQTLQPRGEPNLIEQHIGYAPTLQFGAFSTSNHDIIAFAPRVIPNRRLEWVDRQGKPKTTAIEPADWGTTSLSLLKDKALVTRADPNTANIDVWQVDLGREVASPMTSQAGDENHPVWAPDGSAFAYTWNGPGYAELHLRTIASGRDDLIALPTSYPLPDAFTPDGRYIIYSTRNGDGRNDLFALELTTRNQTLLVDSPSNQTEGAPSPDGRWIAFTSDVSGRDEIYVQPFLRPGARVQISSAGGDSASWSRDGRELFYMTLHGELSSVRVTTAGDRFSCSTPSTLFSIPGMKTTSTTFRTVYAPGDDGRFLLYVTSPSASPETITASVHWRTRS